MSEWNKFVKHWCNSKTEKTNRSTKRPIRTKESPQDKYSRWWCGVKLADGRIVSTVEWIGPPSGVYGVVRVTCVDETEFTVSIVGKMRPSKTDIHSPIYSRSVES